MSEALPGGVRCLWMRGGTSKGGYFLAEDLPADPAARDAFLRRVMGSPDPRQIDGMGGADPLTSKVAVVSPSGRAGVDVDYLFLQVSVDAPLVSDAQTCGNILAGVGPFAIERGLLPARDGETPVTIHLVNTGQTAVATVQTPGGTVRYAGDARIDGVPGAAAPVPLQFRDTAGATCGALLPTGRACDRVDGIEVTLIDNGMPCVVLRAADAGIAGTESREALDADEALKIRLERLRLACGPLMNLGNVVAKTVPKMTMVSAPQHGGAINTRTFIPHRCHATIGVLGAVSVATACLLPGSPAAALADLPPGNPKTLEIEHPSGQTSVIATLADDGSVASAAILRTANKLMDGTVFAG
ncbi:MAG: 4-oxalomesaconate tautomerase [Rhodospirillaceae bacterium]|nr:4-oxalomesaconate tautomerase [Rhodospirillaceae bacterium]